MEKEKGINFKLIFGIIFALLLLTTVALTVHYVRCEETESIVTDIEVRKRQKRKYVTVEYTVNDQTHSDRLKMSRGADVSLGECIQVRVDPDSPDTAWRFKDIGWLYISDLLVGLTFAGCVAASKKKKDEA